jgi:hypothetical protein
MRQITLAVVIFFVLVLLASAPVTAQQAGPSDSKKSEEQAMAVLKRMAEFIAKAKSFSVTIDAGFDAVQESGQKIEFGETRKVVLRRPDRLRVDTTKRNGSQDGLIFDGKEITVFHSKENVYATAAKPGSVDQAVNYLVNDLDTRVPLAELLNSNLDKALPQRVRSAAYVEQSSIGGVPSDHVAFRGDEADLQLWVARDKQPLPRRIVITYKQADGRPQFWAQFSDWNLSVQTPDSLFVYKPSKDAARIAFSPRQLLQPGNEPTKGAQ